MSTEKQSRDGGLRQAFFAAILTFVVPGLGQLYAGRTARAIAIVAVMALASPLMTMAFATKGQQHFVLMAIAIAAILFRVAVSVDAGRSAFLGGELPNPRATRIRRYVLFTLVSLAAIELEQAFIRELVAAPFVMPSESMAPALLPGDYFMVDKRAFARVAPVVGDVVMVTSPKDPQAPYVKRVAAVPHDVVEYEGGRILVNGVELPGARSSIKFARTVVAPDSYFVVGDNRDGSLDSRLFGSIHRDAIEGRAVTIYFSKDPESGSIRWSRIGERVE